MKLNLKRTILSFVAALLVATGTLTIYANSVGPCKPIIIIAGVVCHLDIEASTNGFCFYNCGNY